jgi:23S rRNA pseudouridine2457 synthase
MVSQFISTHDVRLLGDLDFNFPEGTHAIGRLDNESEGLLILTTNKKVTRLLFNPTKQHLRTYLVMVNRVVTEDVLQQMKTGVSIPVKNGQPYFAVPYEIELVNNVQDYYMHMDDYRQAYPHSWLLITLTEGKFHQVRKMCLAVNRRCLRLVRLSIENLQLNNLQPGGVKEYSEEDFFASLGIEYAT